MLEILLALNTLWFAMGFNVFAIRNKVFAKLLVPREHRNTPVFDILAASGRFLGGFNFAFCALSLLLLLNLDTFPGDEQRFILLLVLAIAHGSQFVFNIPIAIQNRRGGGVWQVKGTMQFIFITDCTLMLLNLVAALSYL